jgi:hypothetical protein
MTADPSSQSVEAFLERFFGGENRIELTDVEGAAPGARWARLGPWVAPLRLLPPHPTLLPCWRRSGQRAGHVDWYALVFSERQLRGFSEELLAFVGPTYSTFRGHHAPLDPADPVEAAVLTFTGGRGFRFRAGLSKEDGAAMWKALERWRSVRGRRRERAPEVPRTTWRLLRDFQMSLRAGQPDLAEGHMRVLESECRLDARNLLFLRVQLLAESGRWNELLALPELPDLLRIRYPAPVAQALIEAVYLTHLASFEAAGDAAGAVASFRRDILPEYASLYVTRRGLRSSEALTSFMLAAVAGDPPDRRQGAEVLQIAQSEGLAGGFMYALAALLPAPAAAPAADPLSLAVEAVLDSDYEAALTYAKEAPAGLHRMRILFDCAHALATVQAEAAAVMALDALPETERTAFLAIPLNREFHARLAGNAAGTVVPFGGAAAVPTDWVAWVRRLNTDPTWSRARALQVAQQGALEWSVAALRAHPVAVEELVAVLQATRSPEADETLHLVLPSLIVYLQRDRNTPSREFAPLYEAVIELLVMGTSGGEEDRALFFDLTAALLAFGMTPEQYRVIVGEAVSLWDRYHAPATLTWALDYLDLLLAYPCPDTATRASLLHALLGRLGAFHRKVEDEQWRMLRLLCSDLGEPATFEGLGAPPAAVTAIETDPLEALGKRTIAIYTLTERAGRRAAEVLKRRAPGVRVDLFHDVVGSDRLEQAARNADVFVVVTASATHAATGVIDAERPPSRPLLRPAGKGTASILQSIQTYLEQS